MPYHYLEVDTTAAKSYSMIVRTASDVVKQNHVIVDDEVQTITLSYLMPKMVERLFALFHTGEKTVSEDPQAVDVNIVAVAVQTAHEVGQEIMEMKLLPPVDYDHLFPETELPPSKTDRLREVQEYMRTHGPTPVELDHTSAMLLVHETVVQGMRHECLQHKMAN